jgi:uncharacterized spore protein YtfJ
LFNFFNPGEKRRTSMELEKRNSAETFIGGIAEKLAVAARATTIFGDPVEREGVTIIPVAKARFGFGGGAGRGKDEDGGGGGGAMQVTPVGFIELKTGAAEFRAIRTTSLPWMVAGGIAAFFLLRKVLS